MDEFLRFLDTATVGPTDEITAVMLLFRLCVSLLCCYVIIRVYRYTHRAADYSQGYVGSLMLMGLVTTVIMIVIGSSIARAFALVGALSIVRFRNAVKETRDVAFIYFVMGMAMASGTGIWEAAVVGTLVIAAVLIGMHVTNFGASTRTPERLLTVQLRPGLDPTEILRPVLDELFEKHAILSLENVRQGMYTEVVLAAPKENIVPVRVLEAISSVNDNLKIRYDYASNTDDV